MMICQKAKECKEDCLYKEAHEHNEHCNTRCMAKGMDYPRCIAFKKEEKTMGNAIEEIMNAIFEDLPTAKEIENNLKTWGFEIKESAFKTQVNGNHYTKLAIQPMEYSMKNNLNPLQHTIIKYITRYKDKNGLDDLLKAKHCIDMIIEIEYGDKNEV